MFDNIINIKVYLDYIFIILKYLIIVFFKFGWGLFWFLFYEINFVFVVGKFYVYILLFGWLKCWVDKDREKGKVRFSFGSNIIWFKVLVYVILF